MTQINNESLRPLSPITDKGLSGLAYVDTGDKCDIAGKGLLNVL